MKARGWKHCPGTSTIIEGFQIELHGVIGCQTPIEKAAGCNHMTVGLALVHLTRLNLIFVSESVLLSGAIRTYLSQAWL